MLCPVTPAHRMKEVAPSLWQCPKCGAGPRDGVYYPFWSLSCVETLDGASEGLATRYDPHLHVYVVTAFSWKEREGVPVAGTLEETLIEYLSTRAELETGLLPVTTASGSGCSSELRRLMFSDPEGLKQI